MDMTSLKGFMTVNFKKYRYVLLVVLAGFILMSVPETEADETTPTEQEDAAPQLQESLEEILSLIQGAGRVEVLLTQESGEEILYQTDDNKSSDSLRRDTVMVSNASREEAGLVKRVDPPIYRGAIVVCQGADNASVRLSVVEAVKSVTGLTADRITVLKMK